MSLKKRVRSIANRFGVDICEYEKDGFPDLYYDLYGEETVRCKRFYNIGAGSFRHPAWTNVDHESEWYEGQQGQSVGIDWDLLSLTPIPVESDTAQAAYTSHTIEHITDAAAANLFGQMHRILKKGGFFRLTMPDVDLSYRAYRDNDRHFFYWSDRYSKKSEWERVKLSGPMNQASIQQLFLWFFASSVSTLHVDGSAYRITDEEVDRVFSQMPYEEALNYCTSKCDIEVQRKYPGNHINWWNTDKLFRMLREAGFENVYRSGYSQSHCPVMRNVGLFDRARPKMSLYVEAVK